MRWYVVRCPDCHAVVMEIAAEHADGRLVSVLEGGYSLNGLTSATTAHLRRLADV